MTAIGLVADPLLAEYGFPNGHPFGPDRLQAFLQQAKQQGLLERLHLIEPALADDLVLQRFHAPEYLAFVRAMDAKGEGFLDAGDTPAFPGVYRAAARVVGAALAALEAILSGKVQRAFVPIGGLHHARRNTAAGFCVFNDIGVVIETLKEQGLVPIVYVDIDAHHGDGVFYAFEDDPDLWIVDIHEDGRFLYPGTGDATETGTGPARGTKRNFALPPDADDRAFFAAWKEAEAHLARVRPKFVLLQCGADSIAGDPLTHLRFSPNAHAHAASALARYADDHAEGRLLAFGGGGYDRRNLAAAWCAVLRAWLHG